MKSLQSQARIDAHGKLIHLE